ncbi:cupin domain-containing protein [Paenibacillus graminis]|jgi:quercetin dioxygenase-like cupin family protein|uniref:Cupin n=1 Tax=Paenibacillus graminis TaxID=189425 RepID=A0A089NQ71_9BACL|nr:cupin domain-containing protein [Paenibacillus graminis]AIQ71229.1 cupin [Paenibacillus graminis]
MEKKIVAEAIQYQEEHFTKRVLFQKGDSLVFVLNFMPGQQLPVHKHPGAEVYLLALKGKGSIQVNDVDYAFVEGEILHIAGDESFAYKNTSDQPASLHVVLSKTPAPMFAKEI